MKKRKIVPSAHLFGFQLSFFKIGKILKISVFFGDVKTKNHHILAKFQ